MSKANVRFDSFDKMRCAPGEEETFAFACPNHKGRMCGNLVIAGKTALRRNGQNQNGGIAQWDWSGNRDAPTFTPSVNCKGCWHGYIRDGRCLDTNGHDEPEP